MLQSNAFDLMFSEIGNAVKLLKPRSLNCAFCRNLKRCFGSWNCWELIENESTPQPPLDPPLCNPYVHHVKSLAELLNMCDGQLRKYVHDKSCHVPTVIHPYTWTHSILYTIWIWPKCMITKKLTATVLLLFQK